MKCPKCGYLGFETSDRCRHCSYDFSLVVAAELRPELPLRRGDEEGRSLADLDLGGGAPPQRGASGEVDLDRLIGGDAGGDVARLRPSPPAPAATESLPLFPADERDDLPLITVPRTPRAPLSVRRTTPEVPRRRTPPAAGRADFALAEPGPTGRLVSPASRAGGMASQSLERRGESIAHPPAGSVARVLALLIDAVLLLGIDLAVVYLTLGMLGLTPSVEALNSVRLVPLVGFLVILAIGYQAAFVAATGQTIGKMVTHLRVMDVNDQRVDVSGAVLRAFGGALSVLTAGLLYLPAYLSKDRRAVHDRLAGTRVVDDR